MEVVQVNGNVIGELSRLVKKVGEQQREIVLELSKELGKHNKMIEQAIAKEDRLLSKINRIEEKMMQKELYNYTNIQQQIKRRKEMAALAHVRNKEDDENVIPAIFQQMERAEDSEGFDSCEEHSDSAATGNPFQDFNKHLQEVEDENLKLSIQIGRKMIVDYIDSCSDTDFEEWKHLQKNKGKSKQFPISVWVPQRAGTFVKLRVCTPLPDCKLEDVLPFLSQVDKRRQHEPDFDVLEIKKELPINTKLVYVRLKQIWPVGARDFLVMQHAVIYQDKAWIVSYSVEDDDHPPSSGLLRIEVICNFVFLKPNPEIRGYTMITENEFNFGGNIPNSMVLNKQIEGSTKGFQIFQKLVEEAAAERLQKGHVNQNGASDQIVS